MKPISALIATYNHGDYVVRAIESVLAQTRPPDEVIVIDDGSTDGTAELIRGRFGASVRYAWQKNRGPAAARNAGLRLCCGDWVAFLDADDTWLPRKLEAQEAALARHARAALVACDCLRCQPDGTVIGSMPLPGIEDRRHMLAQLTWRCLFVFSSVMARRDALLAHGGFPEDLRGGEDHLAWSRIAASHDVVAVHEPLVRYTSLPTGLSSNPRLLLTDVIVARRRVREAIVGHRPWPLSWWDGLCIRYGAARSHVSAAEIYRDRGELRQAGHTMLRATPYWPLWPRHAYPLLGSVARRGMRALVTSRVA